MATQKNRRHDLDVELTLERGQVTTLIVGSVVALGAVFLVGVGVGRRLAPVPSASPTAAEPIEESGSVPTLTFHDTLTQETVEEVAPVVKKAPAKVAVAAKASEKKASAKQARSDAAKIDAAALAKAHVAVVAQVAKKSPESAEKSPAEKTAVATARSASDARAEAKVANRFAVQVASSQKEADIDRLAARIRESGYTATIVPAEIPGRGRWYRLQVGSFANREDAAMKQAELKVALDLSGLVVTI